MDDDYQLIPMDGYVYYEAAIMLSCHYTNEGLSHSSHLLLHTVYYRII